MSWAAERARFPVFERYAYLNAGTNGPLSRATVDAVAAVQALDATEGRAHDFDALLEQRERIRRLLAAELGVDASNVAITDSTSRAVQIVLAGLALGPGDEVVTTDAEHFGLLGPLTAAEATLRIVPIRGLPAADIADAIADQITERTRLLALSAVLWLDGTIVPWRELRRRTDVRVLVDGAQSVGALAVDAAEADYYTVSGQKWLCGPEATGALYVREPEELPLRLVGYLAPASYDLTTGAWKPKAGAARFDSGLTPPAATAGLEAALTNVPSGRFERAAELTQRCRDLLLGDGHDVLTQPGQGTLVAFRSRIDPIEARAALREQGVIVRNIPGTDLLRASVGWWNDEADLERLVEALAGL